MGETFIVFYAVIGIMLLIWCVNAGEKKRRDKFQAVTPTSDWITILDTPNILFLDTETTGLKDWSEVVQIAVINRSGDVLLDALNLPQGSIERDASDIHGLTKRVIRKQGFIPWPDIHAKLVELLPSAPYVITFNSDFDERLIQQTSKIYGLRLPAIKWYCAMKSYSGEGRYLSLTEAATWEGVSAKDAHSALGDVKITLALMEAVVDRTKSGKEAPSQLIQHLMNANQSRRSISRTGDLDATERQKNFIQDLLYERRVPQSKEDRIVDDLDLMTREEASKTIDYLLGRPEI